MVVAGTNRPSGLLLDTNIVVAILKREEVALVRLEEVVGSLFVPVIALGELRFGARKSGRVEENLQRVEGFAAETNILPCDEETARIYGDVKDSLRRKGRPIPENDIWIAAVTQQHGLVLVTRDGHFEHIEGLWLERW